MFFAVRRMNVLLSMNYLWILDEDQSKMKVEDVSSIVVQVVTVHEEMKQNMVVVVDVVVVVLQLLLFLIVYIKQIN